MKKLRIGLDFDGVIANTPHLKSIVAKELFNVDIDPEDMLASHVFENNIMDIDAYHQLQQEIYFDHPEWHHQLQPIKGALEGIGTLQLKGHLVYCITSRTPEAVGLARQWFETHALLIEVHDTASHPDKTEIAKILALDAFIDDDPQFLEPLIGVVPHLLLYSWKYNEAYTEPKEIKRTRSWDDIQARIRTISEEESSN